MGQLKACLAGRAELVYLLIILERPWLSVAQERAGVGYIRKLDILRMSSTYDRYVHMLAVMF